MTASTKRTIVLVGSIIAVLIILALAVPAVSRILETTSESSHDLPADLTSLTVDGDVGDIEIRAAGPGEAPQALSTVRSGLSRPTVEAVVDGTSAVLTDRCGGGWWDNCSVTWEVVVPADSTLLVNHSVGDITVTDVTGPVSLASNVGDITGTGLAGHTVRAQSDVGDVSLDLTQPPEDLQASADTGDLSVTVPNDGTPYRVLTEASVGEVRNGIGSDLTQTRVIDLRTSVGDITLRRAG